MRCFSRSITRPRACISPLWFLLLGTIITLATIGYNIIVFAKAVKLHTVSERDLPPGYQLALAESLLTVPCCRAANWTPSAHEVVIEQIPRIIHQTYKTRAIPEGDWQTAHNLCLNLHRKSENWRHILWTDETARRFIEHEYPEFLHVYDRYPYPIQRVDAMRYFILHHYGGIYLDLDIGCARSMESLLQFPAFLPKTTPSGVSNDLMASRPGHPFMLELGTSLQKQGGWVRYGTKYMTVFFSTGPMFVNRILARYWQIARDPADRVIILPQNFYSESLTAYFMHFPGSSWHGSDAHGVMMVYTHGWIVGVVLLAGYIGYSCRRAGATGQKRGNPRRRRRRSSDYEMCQTSE
ncbi:protein of unknown function [Taphrina deformans PYCC 5710]|uniref:Mannosyl phosphorylinositol ceramide synthase SUR1 n=1 Tax=Taphrina deformans (strain PYCC 5710 / ATCC 11124 / CBS 356.35 / IMI 108563 / JCM 9778 / NBRC 8474) TaxID=1097556 RepID=R4XGX0_TAPDE|nr:protein of unknown function [Taphrina deformans PYCC 5710]|eukprot:CCG83753.1 protein of unknown function [Taphrina deformans PYCC 5710]